MTDQEREMADKIVKGFRQKVCGFDILRTKDTSYVCDVNGFSLVKKNEKYYDKCARALREIIHSYFEPTNPPFRNRTDSEKSIAPNSTFERELKCVVAIMRHSDRTPKQKIKMFVVHSDFRKIFEKYGGKKKGAVKLKVKLSISAQKMPKEVKI